MGAAESKGGRGGAGGAGGAGSDLFAFCEPHKDEDFLNYDAGGLSRTASGSSVIVGGPDGELFVDHSNAPLPKTGVPQGVLKRTEIAPQRLADCMHYPILEGPEFHLHRVAARGDMALPQAEKLLKNGSDVDRQDMYFRTPLHFAARSSALKMIYLLLSKGADREIENVDNKTAMDVAVASGSLNAVALLESVQEDIETNDDDFARTASGGSRQGGGRSTMQSTSATSVRSRSMSRAEEEFRQEFEKQLPYLPSDIDRLLSEAPDQKRTPMRNQLVKPMTQDFEDRKEAIHKLLLSRTMDDLVKKQLAIVDIQEARGKMRIKKYEHQQVKDAILEGDWDERKGYIGKNPLKDLVGGRGLMKQEHIRQIRLDGVYSLDPKRRVYSTEEQIFSHNYNWNKSGQRELTCQGDVTIKKNIYKGVCSVTENNEADLTARQEAKECYATQKKFIVGRLPGVEIYNYTG